MTTHPLPIDPVTPSAHPERCSSCASEPAGADSTLASVTGTPSPGLVWGHRFDVTGHATPTSELQPIESPTTARGEVHAPFRWLHLDLVDQRAVQWVSQQSALEPALREFFVSHEEHQRWMLEGGCFAAVLHSPIVEVGRRRRSRRGALHLLVGPGFVLTGRHEPLLATRTLHELVSRGRELRSPGELTGTLARILASAISAVLREFSSELDALEDALIDARPIPDSGPDARRLAAIRRRTVDLTRQVLGLRAIFGELAEEEEDDVPHGLHTLAEQLEQRLAALLGEARAIEERARLIQEEILALLTARMNRHLYVLSVLTLLFLPPTLVTGLFGMNATGHPLESIPHGFGLGLLGVALSPAVIYAILHRARTWPTLTRSARDAHTGRP